MVPSFLYSLERCEVFTALFKILILYYVKFSFFPLTQ